jgi:hypothetical protein
LAFLLTLNLPHFAIVSHIWIGLPTSYFHATNANDVNLQNFISKKKRGKQKKGIEGREQEKMRHNYLCMVHNLALINGNYYFLI